MSNIIPPLVNSSPPPMVAGEPDDLDDDEFGDFAVANLSYDGYSLPTTPQHELYSNFPSVCNSFVTNTESNFSTKQNDIEVKDNIIPETSKCRKNEDQEDEIIKVKCRSSIEDNCEDSNNIFCDIKTDVYIQQQSVNNCEQNVDVNHSNLLTNSTQNITGKEENTGDLATCKENMNSDSLELQTDDVPVCKRDNFEDDLFGDFSSTFPGEKRDLKLSDPEERTHLKLPELICENNTTEVNFNQHTLFNEYVSHDEIQISEVLCEDVNNLRITENDDLILPNIETEKEIVVVHQFNSEEQNDSYLNFNSFQSADSDFDNFENDTLPNQKNEEIIEENINFTVNRLGDKEDSLRDFGMTNISESEQNNKIIFNFNDNTLSNINIAVLEAPSTEAKCALVVDKPQFDVDIDFGDFESSNVARITSVDSETLPCGSKSVIDECGEDLEVSDFQKFDCGATEEQENLDDFGDFSDYSTQDENLALSISVLNSSDKLTNIEKIIKNSFPYEECKEVDLEFVDFKESEVFKQIQDLENTNALTYNWINSESQKALLKSLNIDSRNILYGPRWNATMPRFAANLGFTPLEPVRSELSSTSQQQTPPPPPVEQNQNDIPAVSFDWTSAGLTNPLDCQQTDENKTDTEDLSTNFTLELHGSKQFDTISSSVSHPDSSVSSNINKLAHSDTESVNSLKFIEASADIENEIKVHSDNCSLDKVSIEDNTPAFTDFTSVQLFHNENVQMQNSHILKLRESHISSQPEHGLDNQTSIPKSDSYQSFNQEILEDDDFTDFQMSLPVAEKPVATLQPLKPVVIDTVLSASVPQQINWPEPGIVSGEIEEIDFNFVCSASPSTSRTEPIVEKQEVKKIEEEEDWSDFISADETAKKNHAQGKQNLSQQNFQQSEKTQKNSNKSKNVLDNLFQSTSKPAQQLELSVPNLQNTQIKHSTFAPAFVPNNSLPKSNLYTVSNELAPPVSSHVPYQIPVQTINTPFGGLPQTSLSVYSNYTGPFELSSQSNRTDSFSQIPFHYSTIGKSNPESQFQENSNFQLQSIENTFLQMQNSKQPSSNSALQADDDDWTDFISSQPASNSCNGLPNTQPPKLKATTPFTSNYSKSMMSNWSLDMSPNIITNPVHFEVISGYQTSSGLDTNENCKKSTNLHSQLKSKHSVPSISALPDLDFIAPKNKFFSKK